jgi:hypothetical protein
MVSTMTKEAENENDEKVDYSSYDGIKFLPDVPIGLGRVQTAASLGRRRNRCRSGNCGQRSD